MKKYITAISLQNDFTPVVYEPKFYCKNPYMGETRFPIISLIANKVEAGEEIEIIPILLQREAVKDNYAVFKKELSDLASEKGFSYKIAEPIYKESGEDVDNILKLFWDLTKVVEDNDELSACITYGTKTVPILLTMALNYAYKIKKNVTISEIVYGQTDFPKNGEANKQSYLYDTTSLFYINSIIEKVSDLKLSNPEETFRMMLGELD